MNRTAAIAAAATAVAAFAAACGSSGTSSSYGSSHPSSSSASATGGSGMVQARSSSLGRIVVDGSGRTLYVFQADSGTTSHCYGACAQAWPPDTTTGHPGAQGLNAALLGTTARNDHTTQVTYKGHPLYHYSGDTKSGDTNGQGSSAFGGTWYVVGPSGNPITAPSPSSGSSGGSGGY
ncbi:COG4315 family predicted lipoprotein [Streptomyces sp. YIM S03343]